MIDEMRLTSATVLLLALGANVGARARELPVAAAASLSQSQESQKYEEELAEAARLIRTVATLFAEGKYKEALIPAERALAIREKVLGPDDRAVAGALSNLAGVCGALEKYDRARAAYERALSILEKKLGPESPEALLTREYLAAIYYRQKEYGKADEAYERVISIREKMAGVGPEVFAGPLVGLAYVHLASGNFAKREATFTRLADFAVRLHKPLPNNVTRVLGLYICTGPGWANASDEQRVVANKINELMNDDATDETKRRPISGGVMNGRAILRPQPLYPGPAKITRVQGLVVVRVLVDERGRVAKAEAVCGPPELYGVSVEAAKHWKFTPTLLDGRPVPVTGTISFNFKLQ